VINTLFVQLTPLQFTDKYERKKAISRQLQQGHVNSKTGKNLADMCSSYMPRPISGWTHSVFYWKTL